LSLDHSLSIAVVTLSICICERMINDQYEDKFDILLYIYASKRNVINLYFAVVTILFVLDYQR